jgi:hypothetical protein
MFLTKTVKEQLFALSLSFQTSLIQIQLKETITLQLSNQLLRKIEKVHSTTSGSQLEINLISKDNLVLALVSLQLFWSNHKRKSSVL